MAKLSKAEVAKREELIQQMKKNKRNLVKKYGADAEKVMYGRATNLAKKLAEQDMEQNKLKEMVRAALMQEKKPFPDLTGDGKVTKADILKGRGVIDELKQAVVLTDEDHDRLMKNGSVAVNVGGQTIIVALKDFDVDLEDADYESPELDEDLDLGHQDNEPHMLKGDLYRIGKYAMELYQMVDEFEGKGEVDFPHWWQAKIINAREAIESAKHYLDFETKEPEIDAMVGAIDLSGALDNIGVEDEIEEGSNENPKKFKESDKFDSTKFYIKDLKSGRILNAISTQGSKIVFHYDTEADAQAQADWITRWEGDPGRFEVLPGTNPEVEALVNKQTGVKEGLPKGFWKKETAELDEIGVNEAVTSDFEERIDQIVNHYFKGDQEVKKAAIEYASIKGARVMGGLSATASLFKDFYNEYSDEVANQAMEVIDMADDDVYFEGKETAELDESFEKLVSKLEKQGKSKKAATAIAGAVANYKAKGGGKGPTAKQKAK